MTRVGRAVALLTAALTVAACGWIVGPRSWTVTTLLIDGRQLAVTVTDRTGRVADLVDVDPNPRIADQSGEPFNPPGLVDILVLPWVGGACDMRTAITVADAADGRVAVSLAITVAPGACDAIGVPHQLVLRTSPAVPAAAVTVSRVP